MSSSTGEKILVIYSSRSTGKHQVHGMATKTYYGYRKKGDRIHVYEADMKLRPDLFRPVDEKPKAMPRVGMRGRGSRVTRGDPPSALPEFEGIQEQVATGPVTPPPQPMPPAPSLITLVTGETEELSIPADAIADLDWGGKLNKRHFEILADAGVTTLQDVRNKGEIGLLDINGIGPAIAETLLNREDATDTE